MNEKLIKVYHKLLEIEKEKIEKYNEELTKENRLKEEEIRDVCSEFGVQIDELLKEKLLIKYSDGTYRTLHYDMIFRLVNIRVHENGSKIPLEYKIYQRKEPIPNFTEKNIEELNISEEIKKALKLLDKKTLSTFQFEYVKAIIKGRKDCYVISSPTATGKTLIFTIPLLESCLKRKSSILIYPRKALASDQIMNLIEILTYLNDILKRNKRVSITIGIDDGDTPKNDDKARGEFRGIQCPICKRNGKVNKLIFSNDAKGLIIKCKEGHKFDFIIPTQEKIWENPPQILITNGWTLNRRLMETSAQKLFNREYDYIILDESHVYREELGAHIHYVIKRLKSKIFENTKVKPKIILSSATLPRNTIIEFASNLASVEENNVFFEEYEKFLSKSRQRIVIHLVLLPNPFASAEALAENVLLFLTEWSYFRNKKSIFFVDSIHEIHRLYHFVHDIIIKDMRFRALEHLKKEYDEEEPYYWGHYSDKKVSEKDEGLVDHFANSLTYHYGGLDPEKRFKIEEEFKKGIKKCLLATSTLELGIDVGDVSVIAQFRYPYSGESYIQRVGRAGRSPNSYYVTLSILVLSNSPSQLRYLYGQDPKEIFELPENYKIPLPLHNDIIREHHSFFEVLDKLAKHRATFIRPTEIKKHWRGKDYKEIIRDIKVLLKDGSSVAPEKRILLEKYINAIQDREDILDLSTDIFEGEIPPQIKFKTEKLDSIRDLEEWFTETEKEIKRNLKNRIPDHVVQFLNETKNKLIELNQLLEHAHKHYNSGNRDAFEKVCKKAERKSKELKNSIVEGLEKLEDILHEIWNNLRKEGAPVSLRDYINELLGKLKENREKAEKIEVRYNELLAYYSNVLIELDFYIKRRWFEFNLINALNLLGTSKYISLLFEKPLPKIEVVYPGLPRREEFLERTIDTLLWLCTPFRVTPLKEKYYYTVVYGLPPWKYKIKGLHEYQWYEGGDIFTFFHEGKKYTAVTPRFIYMLNLNDNILEAYSDNPGQNSKIILSNVQKSGMSYDLEACRFCTYGFVLTSKQTKVCPRSIRDCSYYTPCQGTKFFQGPNPPFVRTSYLSIVKVYPRIYTHAKSPDHILEEIKIIDLPLQIKTTLFKGSMFDRAITGCYMVSTGSNINFIYPPVFNLTTETLGYRISTNGIRLEFDKNKLVSIVKELLKNSKIYSWILIKYLVSKKYYTEKGDLRFDLCSKAFEGLFDPESKRATKKFKEEFEKLLKKKEINDELINFAVETLLHSISHLFYQYVLEKLQTGEDNLVYYIDRKNSYIYLLENAEKGLGLTETLQSVIKNVGKKRFFIEFLEWSLKILKDCDIHSEKLKTISKKELEAKLNSFSEEEKEIISQIESVIINAQETLKSKYGIDFPIEILRSIVFERFYGVDSKIKRLIPDLIISNVPYCWDGCYNCVRLERGCVHGPFNQITRVSKTLFREFINRIFQELKIPININKGFGWVLNEIDNTKKELRISSPWISSDIIKNHIEPLLKRDVIVKIMTRKDLENDEQIKAVRYLEHLTNKYKSLKVKFVDNLHAKLIIIDEKLGIRGSLNLTYSGLYKNIELVERYEDKAEIQKTIRTFEEMFSKL